MNALIASAVYLARLKLYQIRTRLGLTSPANRAVAGLGDDAINGDAEYALTVARGFLGHLDRRGGAGPIRSLLELGPGRNFGVALALADMVGAEAVAVADRFLTPTEPDYHQRFYAALTQRVEAAGFRPRLLAEATRHGHRAVVDSHAVGLETLDLPAGSVDLVVSQAVLEHVADPRAAFATLFRITRPGGIGLHQVDFRDHRDFARPLALATLSEAAHRRLFAASHGECGCWIRPREMAAMVAESGFAVEVEGNLFADDAQVAAAVARIDPARRLSAADLAIISALIVTCKSQ